MLRPAHLCLLAAVSALTVSACGVGPASRSGNDPLVVASAYPLWFVADRIGGGALEVHDLTPSGAEPHDVELSPRQVALLEDADLLLYVGGGFQPAVEDAAMSGPDTSLDLLEEVPPRELPAEEDDVDEHEDDVDEHGHAPVDPHIWLDPLRLRALIEPITESYLKLLPDQAEGFRNRADQLRDDLTELDEHMRVGLQECASYDLVVSHEAFGYLADRYGLHQIGIAGIDPEGEPTPQRLAEVIEEVRSRGIETIFFERLVGPEVAASVAREAGVEAAALDPLESPPEEGDFFDAMHANLEALRAGLDCG